MQKQFPVSFYLLTLYYFWMGIGGLLTGLFVSFEVILAGVLHLLIFLLFIISVLLKDKTSRILMFITAAVSLLLQLLIGGYCLINNEFAALTAPLGIAILSVIVMISSEINHKL